MKCKTCGKNVTSFRLVIEPKEGIPEITKTVCFCSKRCANNFLGRIKAERTKKKKLDIRKKLELLDHYPSIDELQEIYLTLTPSEKYQLALNGLVASFHGLERKTIKEFYKDLSDSCKK